MRNRPTLIAALAVAVASAVAASAALAGPTVVGPNGNTQAIDVRVTPKRLSPTRPSPVALKVTTKTTSTTAASGIPVPAVRAVIDFPSGLKLFTKGLPTCSLSRLQNTKTEDALRLCGRAKIGSGKATALIPTAGGSAPEHTIVTAFNGAPQGGRPTVLLHTYGVSPVQTTIVLSGVISRFGKQGFGQRLDVDIPLLAGGAGALTDFQVTINRSFRFKGKRRSFVAAVCRKSPLRSRGTFTFKDGEALTAVSTQACKKRR